MSEKLKPCPFCGGKPYIKVVSLGHTSSAYEMGAEVGCETCGFHMRADSSFKIDVYMNVSMCNDGISYMVERWNRRVSDGKID